MEERILIKMDSDESGCYIKTISRSNRSSRRFYFFRKEAEEIEKNGRGIVQDSVSFARCWIGEDCHNGKCVKIIFFWSKCSERDCYTGWMESVSIPYDKFREVFEREDVHLKFLSLQDKQLPKIEFKSRKNLKEVVKHRSLRKKLGRFLSRHFQWKGSERIELYDDFLPYSFLFYEFRPDGKGTVGGVILHGAEDLRKATYGIHT